MLWIISKFILQFFKFVFTVAYVWYVIFKKTMKKKICLINPNYRDFLEWITGVFCSGFFYFSCKINWNTFLYLDFIDAVASIHNEFYVFTNILNISRPFIPTLTPMFQWASWRALDKIRWGWWMLNSRGRGYVNWRQSTPLSGHLGIY